MLFRSGEALIDFIPNENGVSIKDVEGFLPKVGGAPANVCGAYTALGGKADMITQLGNDAFGDKIIEEFQHYGIGCKYILRTDQANTSLAFVALSKRGNREFSFYRKPGADMLLECREIKQEWFASAYALHFCSVSLGLFPMKIAHNRAIEYARKEGAIISFDPNIRLPLWENEKLLKDTVHIYLPLVNIVKVSDEEIEFITGERDMKKALKLLFVGHVQLVLYTKGDEGAELYYKDMCIKSQVKNVQVVDTTGAGDGFMGAFLYQLQKEKICLGENIEEEILQKILDFCVKFASLSVMKKGAISSYCSEEDVLKWKGDF